MDVNLPSEPHWYLPVIGTLPDFQGHGFGAALFAPVLSICDRTGVPAYLEATTDRGRALQERRGVVTTVIIETAGCPPIIPMIRRPR